MLGVINVRDSTMVRPSNSESSRFYLVLVKLTNTSEARVKETMKTDFLNVGYCHWQVVY